MFEKSGFYFYLFVSYIVSFVFFFMCSAFIGQPHSLLVYLHEIMLLSAWVLLSVEVHVYLICDTMIVKIYICVCIIIIIGKYIEA